MSWQVGARVIPTREAWAEWISRRPSTAREAPADPEAGEVLDVFAVPAGDRGIVVGHVFRVLAWRSEDLEPVPVEVTP